MKKDCPEDLIFMDSLQFLSLSLKKLEQAQDPNQFNLLKEYKHP